MAAAQQQQSLNATASMGDALGVSTAGPRKRSAEERELRAQWRERVATYFAIKAPRKTERDVDLLLDHFEPPDGDGYDAMWAKVVERFGPEPPAEQMHAARERLRWYAKLSSYYALVDSSKTRADIIALMDRFVMEGRTYDELWDRVQDKYGVFVDKPHPAIATASTNPARAAHAGGTMAEQLRRESSMRLHGSPQMAGRSPSPINPRSATRAAASPARPFETSEYDPMPPGGDRSARQPQGGGAPLLDSQLVRRHTLIVLLSGVWFKLYRQAGAVQQQVFHRAVTAELANNTNLPGDLNIVRVADHVDGAIVEVDFALPQGWTAEGVGRELVRKVTNGECTVAAIRQAYLEQLKGNAQRVFITDAAVVQSFSTPALRYNLALTGAQSAGEGGVDISRGIDRDDFGGGRDAVARAAGAASAAAARDSVVFPRGERSVMPHTSFTAATAGVAATPRRDARGGGGITEPTVASSPVSTRKPPTREDARELAFSAFDGAAVDAREPALMDSTGRHIREWEVVQRQPVPKPLTSAAWPTRDAGGRVASTSASTRRVDLSRDGGGAPPGSGLVSRGGRDYWSVPDAAAAGAARSGDTTSFVRGMADAASPAPRTPYDPHRRIGNEPDAGLATTPSDRARQAHLRRGGAA